MANIEIPIVVSLGRDAERFKIKDKKDMNLDGRGTGCRTGESTPPGGESSWDTNDGW